jgi:hypothetical protein
MPQHKFLNVDFGQRYPTIASAQGFKTHNVILKTTPYEPKVLIIGTFNPDDGNGAEFFYGRNRNYLWRIFENFSNNNNALNGPADGIPQIHRIFELCLRFKLSFADLITKTEVELDDYSDTLLNRLCNRGQIQNNVEEIVKYICETESINYVYFTTKNESLGCLRNLWTNVAMLVNQQRPDVQFGSILTPSGQGGVTNFIGLHRAATIARYWIWVNAIPNIHPQPFPNQNGYVHLNHQWLQDCNVNINNF